MRELHLPLRLRSYPAFAPLPARRLMVYGILYTPPLENLSDAPARIQPYLRSMTFARGVPLAVLQTKGAHAHTQVNATSAPCGAARALAEVARPSLLFLTALPVYAQSTGSDPWDNAVNVLKTAFTGTIATGLSLVAIVVGGLMFAYGEGQSKKMLAGIVFGVGMAIGAVNFMAWLFPG